VGVGHGVTWVVLAMNRNEAIELWSAEMRRALLILGEIGDFHYCDVEPPRDVQTEERFDEQG